MESVSGTAKKINDHRRAIGNVLRSISASPDACELVLDNFDQAVEKSRRAGVVACADKVICAATSLGVDGSA